MNKKIVADFSKKQTRLIGELFVNDFEKDQAKARNWILEQLKLRGIERKGVNPNKAPQNINYPYNQIYYETLYDMSKSHPSLLPELVSQGWIRLLNMKNSRHKFAEWVSTSGPDSLSLRALGFTREAINKAWEMYHYMESGKYISSVIEQLSEASKTVVLTGGLYFGCLRAVLEYLFDNKELTKDGAIHVIVFEPAIFPAISEKDMSDRETFVELTRIEKPYACCYVDGRAVVNPTKSEAPKVIVDIYSSRENFTQYFDKQQMKVQKIDSGQ